MSDSRASLSHPLNIATFDAGGGRIGVTLAPGKFDPHSSSGEWRRDLATDLLAVKAWEASVVVTLIEDHEFQLLAIPKLGAEVQALGMDWIHAPIPDLCAPNARFDAAWPALSAHLLGVLSQGGGVLLHCRGGIGRACTIAARLLVDLGEQPTEAIAQMRRVRSPLALETEAQERWVATGPRLPVDG